MDELVTNEAAKPNPALRLLSVLRWGVEHNRYAPARSRHDVSRSYLVCVDRGRGVPDHAFCLRDEQVPAGVVRTVGDSVRAAAIDGVEAACEGSECS